MLRSGIVTTNAVRTGADRRVLETLSGHLPIYYAWSDQLWVVDGASVRVSILCVAARVKTCILDGRVVSKITPSLSEFSEPLPAQLIENVRGSYTGVFLNGPFEIRRAQAVEFLNMPANVNGRPNSEVIKRTVNGQDILQRGEEKWVVDFGPGAAYADAIQYEAPFDYVEKNVKPYRQRLKENGKFEVRRKNHREKWWVHAEARPGMRSSLNSIERYIATPMVSSTRVFFFLPVCIVPNQKLVIFPRDDLTALGILSSSIHEKWTLEYCSWIGAGNDPTYATRAVFATFPFPEGLTPDISASAYSDDPHAVAISRAAANLIEKRERWLNPPELVRREQEVVTGFPRPHSSRR